MIIDRLKTQHSALLELANELAAQLNPAALSDDSGPAAELLNRITGELLAHLELEDGELYPGLFCRILAPIELEDVLLVPELAIQRDIVGPYLLVVDDQNTVRRLEVELGPLIGRRRVIEPYNADRRTGLDGSERVVVKGLQRAREGVVVNPEVEPPARDA